MSRRLRVPLRLLSCLILLLSVLSVSPAAASPLTRLTRALQYLPAAPLPDLLQGRVSPAVRERLLQLTKDSNPDSDIQQPLERYLTSVICGHLLPVDFIFQNPEVIDSESLTVVSGLEALRGHQENARRLFDELLYRLERKRQKRDVAAADFFRLLSGYQTGNTSQLLNFATHLDLTPHDSLFRAGRSLSRGDFPGFIRDIVYWNISLLQMDSLPDLLIQLNSLLLALTCCLLLITLGRWIRWFPVIHHESQESDEPFSWVGPDRFGRRSGSYLRTALYALATGLLIIEFCHLSLVTGPGQETRRALRIAEFLQSRKLQFDETQPPWSNLRLATGSADYLLACLRIQNARSVDAGPALERITPDSPFYAAARFRLGLLSWKEHNFESARQHFLAGLDILPHPYLRYGLWQSLERLGRKHEAVSARERLLGNVAGKNVITQQDFFRQRGGEDMELPATLAENEWIPGRFFLPDLLHFILSLSGCSAGIFALWAAYLVFSREFSPHRIRRCRECQTISCDQCRVTVGLCPICMTSVPPSLDEQILADSLHQKLGYKLLAASIVLPGIACFSLRRFVLSALILIAPFFITLFFTLTGYYFLLPSMTGELSAGSQPVIAASARVAFCLWTAQLLLALITVRSFRRQEL